MSQPKRHHYVPQFYLRRFACEAKAIRCFNKAKRLLIPRASIKGQCAIDNYYGWNDQVEPSFGVVEGHIASMIRTIVKCQDLPPPHSDEWHILLIFVALQAARTKLSGDSHNVMTDYFMKLRAKGEPGLDGINLDDILIKETYPTAMPIKTSVEAFEYLLTLDRALLINNTAFPFFCSDNPVVLYNSQRSHWRDRGVIGLDSSGLQIFLPLDPIHALYLYDSEAYSRPTNTGLRKIGIEDACKINVLQYLWSDENIYFANAQSDDLIRALAELLEPYRVYDRVRIRESAMVEKEDGTTSSLVMQYRPHAPVEMSLSFARTRPVEDDGRVEARSMPKVNRADSKSGTAFQFDALDTQKYLNGEELTKGIKQLSAIAQTSPRSADNKQVAQRFMP